MLDLNHLIVKSSEIVAVGIIENQPILQLYLVGSSNPICICYNNIEERDTYFNKVKDTVKWKI